MPVVELGQGPFGEKRLGQEESGEGQGTGGQARRLAKTHEGQNARAQPQLRSAGLCEKAQTKEEINRIQAAR